MLEIKYLLYLQVSIDPPLGSKRKAEDDTPPLAKRIVSISHKI